MGYFSVAIENERADSVFCSLSIFAGSYCNCTIHRAVRGPRHFFGGCRTRTWWEDVVNYYRSVRAYSVGSASAAKGTYVGVGEQLVRVVPVRTRRLISA